MREEFVRQLAVNLHGAHCRRTHVQGDVGSCSWYFEESWSQPERMRWLRKAHEVSEEFTPGVIQQWTDARQFCEQMAHSTRSL